MDMTYLQAKDLSNALTADVKRFSAALDVFPKGPMGPTPEAVRVTPEYRAAKTAFDAAFKRLRAFNGQFVKVFAKEIRAERREHYAQYIIQGETDKKRTDSLSI